MLDRFKPCAKGTLSARMAKLTANGKVAPTRKRPFRSIDYAWSGRRLEFLATKVFV